MEVRSQILIMSLPEGEPLPFTQRSRDTEPRFSPDGSDLAFVRPDEQGRKQLWTIPLDRGEARRITDVPGGVSDHAWSPDSRYMAFVSHVAPESSPATKPGTAETPQVRIANRIRYRADGAGWRGDAFHHLFIVDVETGENRQITGSEADDASPVWSPDGARIAFISDRSEARDISWNAEVYVVDVEGGEPREWSQGLHCFSQYPLGGAVAWSPDGTKLAVIGTDDDDLGDPRQAWLFVVEPGSAPLRLTDGSYTPVLPARELRWTAGGRIIFLGDRRGESFLCQVPAAGGELKTVQGGGAQYSALALDATAGKAVVVETPPASAGDLQLIDVATGERTRLTHSNEEYFRAHPVADLTKFTITRGGLVIESRVLLPPGVDRSRRHPLIVDIHGGPNGRFWDTFNTVQQVLATAGYIVLAVNPRGSSSYGPEFANAVLGDWGGEDYLDIMAAVHEVCSRDYVDVDRLGLHGYSYGGFMSSWIVGHDTRFGAAVVGAPVINLVSMYGMSDIGVSFGEPQFGGTLNNAFDAFVERSPLSYATNVETPVLLLHGEEDNRCPIGQSEEYFVSLKRLGKEVEFVRFPGSSHSLVRSGHPKMREEYLARTLAWFDKHLVPSP
jgi:dipeptidyl aminopeptidase/acylaminoacyl peptidase